MTIGQLNPDQIASSEAEYVDRYLTDVIYSDIDLRFSPHPFTGDISILEDITAVKNALKNLVLTQYGDRPFQPNFGTAVANQLFEPAYVDYVTISESIRRSVQLNEPRVKIEDITIDEESIDSNTLTIQIVFKVKYLKESTTLNLRLKRNR